MMYNNIKIFVVFLSGTPDRIISVYGKSKVQNRIMPLFCWFDLAIIIMKNFLKTKSV